MKSQFTSRIPVDGYVTKSLLGMALLGMASVSAFAAEIGPLANTSAANARVIVPDGTSVFQTHGGSTRWFAFGAEPGKTYAVEIVDPYGDLGANAIGAVGLFASNGISAPPEAQLNCSQSAVAPSLEAAAADGIRCLIRTNVPQSGTLQNKRGIYISVGAGQGASYQLRARESTIYGRWTTNGYDFHVELQNTSADSLCAQVAFYPNSGGTYTGSWNMTVGVTTLAIPPFGANKYIHPNGTLAGTDNRGTMRIHACPGAVNFNPAQLHVSTYAYNPVTDKYLYFFTGTANGGAASNTW